MPALSPDLDSLEVIDFANSTVEIDLDKIAVQNQVVSFISTYLIVKL